MIHFKWKLYVNVPSKWWKVKWNIFIEVSFIISYDFNMTFDERYRHILA